MHSKVAGDHSHLEESSLECDQQQREPQTDDVGRIRPHSSDTSATSPMRPFSFGSCLRIDDHEHIIQLGGSQASNSSQAVLSQEDSYLMRAEGAVPFPRTTPTTSLCHLLQVLF